MDITFQLLKAKREISDPAYWRRFGNPGPLVTPRIPKKKKAKRVFDDSGLSEEDKTKYALEREEDETRRKEEKARILQENQERRQRYQERISEMQSSYQEQQRRKQEEERLMTEAQAVGEVGQDDPESMYENLDWDRMRTGEPMDISFQLLKEDDFPRQTYEEMFNEPPPDIHPGHVSELGLEGDSSLSDESNRRANAYREAYIDGRYDPGEYGPWWQGLPKVTETLGTEEEDALFSTAGPYKIPVRSAATARKLLGRELPIRVQQARIQDDEAPSFYGFQFNDATHFTRSEPMDIAFQLLKERKSPEAMRRKLEYDKQYEKTPERRKYQRELHAERRKRGIYGTGDHMDVSHTQGGRLTLEPEHANRARHFKDRGTLRVV